QAGRDAVAGERLLALEALPDRGQHRHLPVGPLDPADTLGRQGQVLYVESLGGCHSLCLSRRQATSRSSCFRCSHSSASRSIPASQESTAARSAGSRRSRAANDMSPSSTPKRRRSAASERSWFSSRRPYSRQPEAVRVGTTSSACSR